jgi:5-methylcytosine-specific restriction endonuclease McrA
MSLPPSQAAGYYKGKLSKLWHESPMYHAAKARAWRRTGVSACEKCGTEMDSRLLDIDHIEPKQAPGQDPLDIALFAARLNCPVTGLQALCKGCHNPKTGLENSKRTGTRQKAGTKRIDVDTKGE